MPNEDITRWFELSGDFWNDVDSAAAEVLRLVRTSDRAAFQAAVARLNAALARGQGLPPIPNLDAQRHFAAGLARYRDGAEMLAKSVNDAEVSRAIRAVDASHAEFKWMAAALEVGGRGGGV